MPRLKEPPALTCRWRAEVDDYVTAVGWSANGKFLAVTSAGGGVVLFDATTGEPALHLEGHAGGSLCLAWSPGDRLLATGGQDGTARLWDPAGGQLAAVLPGGAAWVEHLTWGDAPYLLATAAGRHLRFWTADGKNLYETQPVHTSTISGLLWQPRLQRFVSSCYGAVLLHAPLKAQPVDAFEYRGSLIALTVSPDGAWVACGCQDATVHIWEAKSGEDLQMNGYALKVRELAWNGSGRLLATGGGPDVTVWDFSGRGPAGQRPRVLSAHGRPVAALAFQHRGNLFATADQEGKVALWKPLKSTQVLAVAQTADPVSVLAWHPSDEVFVTGHASGKLSVWIPPTAGLGFGS
jgi:WD40 repeat protein